MKNKIVFTIAGLIAIPLLLYCLGEVDTNLVVREAAGFTTRREVEDFAKSMGVLPIKQTEKGDDYLLIVINEKVQLVLGRSLALTWKLENNGDVSNFTFKRISEGL